MPTPVTVNDLRERARKLWVRDGRQWAAGDTSTATLDIPLHPPTEAEVLRDYSAATGWVDSWRANEDSAIELVWETRRWGRVGEQVVPARACVAGVDALTEVAQVGAQWKRWRSRADELSETLAPQASLKPAIAKHARTIGELDTTDFLRLRDVSRWLQDNPMSDRYIRELPIRGIDSKWLERHRAVVEALVGGDGLSLRRPPALVRIRFLDRSLAPAGLGDVTAPLSDLNNWDLKPSTVLIVENLQTFLALPERQGVIAVDGRGNVAPTLSLVGWIKSRPAIYWGDLDSHGFRILSHARGAGLSLESCLMDSETLYAHRDLWGTEPQPHQGKLAFLTPAEHEAFATLRDQGNVRLEQERIDWAYALERIDDCLRTRL
ncbi:Wadjet anti-phage system protein JetD domain-containing protein [Microcella sp.]|uniref:Wadjet anti-phage system protein JetD domain-containing protein n=1 Tax=Microcella sp. TaxID=1913979 RepID=UPI003F703503